MTRRRWIADEWTEGTAILRNQQAAHLARVLRARVGQEFDLVAGEKVRRGVIEKIKDDAVEFSLHEEIAIAESLPLVIGMSIVRFERMEWAIEKLTELGVARIVPLIAERSEKHLAQAAAKRVDRWRKIARESAQQSRRSDILEIAEPLPLLQWWNQDFDGVRLLLSEYERTQSLRHSLLSKTMEGSKNIYAAIGPEGGWTEREITGFAERGWQPVSLGPRILRAETAAIAFASICGSLFADIFAP
ncbi:MAG: RsmE family RNA methyltransferase [Acidobacteriaceae bacterium]